MNWSSGRPLPASAKGVARLTDERAMHQAPLAMHWSDYLLPIQPRAAPGSARHALLRGSADPCGWEGRRVTAKLSTAIYRGQRWNALSFVPPRDWSATVSFRTSVDLPPPHTTTAGTRAAEKTMPTARAFGTYIVQRGRAAPRIRSTAERSSIRRSYNRFSRKLRKGVWIAEVSWRSLS